MSLFFNKETKEKLFSKAIKTYGADAQCLVAIEEMAELTKAISKEHRARGKENHIDALVDIAEEIADVRIMLEQLCIIYGINTERFEEDKLKRLAGRLEVI